MFSIKIRNRYYKTLFVLIVLFRTFSVSAQDCCASPACDCDQSDIAPSGIMNDHLHARGKWMISYYYMHMNMQNNITGSQAVTDGEVFNSYLMSPSKMTMDMHMLMIMYGLSNKMTLMLMPQYNVSNMNMNMYGNNAIMNMPGMAPNATMPNSQTISGLGDTKAYALFRIWKSSHYNIVGSAGLSLPTGSINQKAFPGLYSNLHADYNMQTGSGTVDFLPGISLVAHESWFDWGAQISGTLRTFYNANGYRLGNEGIAQGWIAKKWNAYFSNSIRVQAIANDAISGYDNNLYSIMEPSANAANYGGIKTMIYPGINFYPGSLFSSTCKIRIEYGLPLFQYAQGIQMADKSSILASIDLIF